MALSKLVKLAMKSGAKQTAKKVAPKAVQGDLFESMAKSPEAAKKELKRLMYTNQERSGQIGGSYKIFEGLEELPTGGKRPIVGDDVTNLNSPFISVEAPAGAKFRNQAELLVDPQLASDIPVGNPIKGSVEVKSNLIDSGNGARWSWIKVPEGYEDNGFLVAVQGPANFTPKGEGHAYTLKTIYEKGGNLTGYDKRKAEFRGMSLEETEALLEEKLKTAKGKERSKIRDQLRGQAPHGRPTTRGIPEFGPIVGEIQMGKKGKKHPVYEYIVMRAGGGSVGRVERNPYGTDYQKLI